MQRCWHTLYLVVLEYNTMMVWAVVGKGLSFTREKEEGYGEGHQGDLQLEASGGKGGDGKLKRERE